MSGQPIDVYLRKVITDAGLDILPEPEQQDLMEKLRAQVDRRVGIIMMQNLDEAGQDELLGMLGEGKTKPDTAGMQALLKTRVPDFEAKLQEALNDLAVEFISAVKKG